MADKLTAIADRKGESPKAEKRAREVSTIDFPYGSLEDAVAVAKAVSAIGGKRASMDQLAPRLGHDTVKSGAFRVKLHAGRVFGLVKTKKDDVELTELGQKINDPKAEAKAKVDAFLAVPLYRRVYDEYRGLERHFRLTGPHCPHGKSRLDACERCEAEPAPSN